MKKGKLLAKDGSEFTVYYHKVATDEKQSPEVINVLNSEGEVEDLNEQDVNENSAGGGMHAAFAAEGGWPPTSYEAMHGKGYALPLDTKEGKKGFFKSKKEFLNKLMAEIKLHHSTAVLDDTLEEGCQLPIDDSIDSDKINEPKVGELYKVKYLNKIARFVCHSQVEGIHSKRYYNMRHHGHEFHVPTDYLLKANDLEANKYLGK